MSSIYSNHRPGFWRVPKFKSKEPSQSEKKKKVHFYDEFVSGFKIISFTFSASRREKSGSLNIWKVRTISNKPHWWTATKSMTWLSSPSANSRQFKSNLKHFSSNCALITSLKDETIGYRFSMNLSLIYYCQKKTYKKKFATRFHWFFLVHRSMDLKITTLTARAATASWYYNPIISVLKTTARESV